MRQTLPLFFLLAIMPLLILPPPAAALRFSDADIATLMLRHAAIYAAVTSFRHLLFMIAPSLMPLWPCHERHYAPCHVVAC